MRYISLPPWGAVRHTVAAQCATSLSPWGAGRHTVAATLRCRPTYCSCHLEVHACRHTVTATLRCRPTYSSRHLEVQDDILAVAATFEVQADVLWLHIVYRNQWEFWIFVYFKINFGHEDSFDFYVSTFYLVSFQKSYHIYSVDNKITHIYIYV